ncbi:hypothetical protein BX600DRAFT_437336 [Xylariales sp. PMI_506]|nr:hypothetical protein BX600DRAFT_437336 [Xylariales sp. PMI_506]
MAQPTDTQTDDPHARDRKCPWYWLFVQWQGWITYETPTVLWEVKSASELCNYMARVLARVRIRFKVELTCLDLVILAYPTRNAHSGWSSSATLDRSALKRQTQGRGKEGIRRIPKPWYAGFQIPPSSPVQDRSFLAQSTEALEPLQGLDPTIHTDTVHEGFQTYRSNYALIAKFGVELIPSLTPVWLPNKLHPLLRWVVKEARTRDPMFASWAHNGFHAAHLATGLVKGRFPGRI